MEGPLEKSAPVLTWGKARNGMSVPLLDGHPLISTYDPQKEATRQAASLLASLQRDPGIRAALIVGTGGKVLLEAISRDAAFQGYEVAFYEPLKEMLACITGQEEHSRSPAHSGFSAGRADVRLLSDWQSALDFVEKQPVLLFPHRGSVQSQPIYRNAFLALESAATRRQINRNTLSRFGSLWSRNLYANAPLLLDAGPMEQFRNAAKEKTAIVLGAGPSLSKHLPSIARTKHRAHYIIIAVDTALSPCRIHGVVPDFVLSVDPQPVNFYHLAGENPEGAVLLVDPACSPLAIRRWSGAMAVMSNPFPLAQEILTMQGVSVGQQLSYGGSVSTNAYDFAFFLGCKGIVLVGQDLSFPDTRVHASGSALEELWTFREHRLSSRETGNYRQRFSVPVVPLPSTGGTVHSNDKLQVFYHWFRQRFLQDQHRQQIALLESGAVHFQGLPTFEDFLAWESTQSTGEQPTAAGAENRKDSPSVTRETVRHGSETAASAYETPQEPPEQTQQPGLGAKRQQGDEREQQNTQWVAPEGAPRDRNAREQSLIQGLRNLQTEMLGLAEVCRSEKDLLRHHERFSRSIRIAGMALQDEVQAMQLQGRVSEQFCLKLHWEANYHAHRIARLLLQLVPD